MRTLIKVKTPKGNATSTNKKLRTFIVGIGRTKIIRSIYISHDDDEFIWEIECSVKRYIKISKNILMYDNLVTTVFNNPLLKKTVKRVITKEQQEELNDMLQNQTTIEIVKHPTTEELHAQYDTWWEKVKTTFKKMKN